MADRIVGISNHTLDTFLAGRARRPERDIVHYYGLDPSPFENVVADRVGFRRQLDLPEDALILLFAGRLVPEKNPVFVVDVLANLRCIEPRAVAVFAGAGSQEHDILDRARELGVANSVRLLGWRNDMPEVMSCSDWFILPHPEHPVEGFGLAIVEAQLAGLRMLLSRGIPDDPLFRQPVFADSHSPTAPDVGESRDGTSWRSAPRELLHWLRSRITHGYGRGAQGTSSTPCMKQEQPIRVLQIIDSLGMGGAETWLMEVLRLWSKSKIAESTF